MLFKEKIYFIWVNIMKASIKQCLLIIIFFTGPCEAAVLVLTKECHLAGLVKSLHMLDLGKKSSLYNQCIFFSNALWLVQRCSVGLLWFVFFFFFNPNHLNQLPNVYKKRGVKYRKEMCEQDKSLYFEQPLQL